MRKERSVDYSGALLQHNMRYKHSMRLLIDAVTVGGPSRRGAHDALYDRYMKTIHSDHAKALALRRYMETNLKDN